MGSPLGALRSSMAEPPSPEQIDAMVPRAEPPGLDPEPSGRRFVLGVSGASGAPYAVRTLEQLLLSGAEVHFVVTEFGRRLLRDEIAATEPSLEQLCPNLAAAPGLTERLIVHPHKNVGAVIASGGLRTDGMAIVPCSSTSLGAIASGSGSNLLTRAAAVTLKERRPLVICHREMPLSLIDIENMRTLALAGATLCSPNPGFYLHPRSVRDIVDFVAGKVLDLLGVEHGLGTRWTG